MAQKRRIGQSILWFLVLVGLAASGYNACARWRVEARNRSVDVAVEFSEIRKLAAASGQPLPDVLDRFRRAGATAVILPEETIGELEQTRRVEVASTAMPGASYLFVHQGNYPRVLRHLKARTHYHLASPPGTDPTALQDVALRVDQPFSLVRTVGVGLDPRSVEAIRAARLGIVGRVENWEGVGPEAVGWLLDDLRASGARGVIFLGDEVLGFKAYVAPDPDSPTTMNTAAALDASGLFYGAVEFGKQRGDAPLNRAAAARTVRVHTVTSAEMPTADIPSNVQRFLLGARERNIRLLFVRLFPEEGDGVETNARYVESIVDGLNRAGLIPGPAHGYAPLSAPRWSRIAIGFGLAAAGLLLLDTIAGLLAGPLPPGVALCALGFAAVLAGLPLVPGNVGPKLAALASSCLLPSLGMLLVDLRAPARGNLWLVALGRVLLASAITLIGVAFITGLLSDRLFLIKADAFIGIKASQFVPLLIVGTVYGLDLRAESLADFRRRCTAAAGRIAALCREPIRFWQVAAVALLLVVLALLWMRSGNDPGIGVSDFELKMRALLDRFLFARPRTKECLFGHPAFFVGAFLALRGRREWALPLLLAGTIGQASLLNAFCHLHTPLLVNAGRAGLGLGIGIALGVLMAALVRPRAPKASGA